MRSPAQNTFKNIGGVFAAQVGDGIFRFIISVLIARFFLVEEYGFLNFAYALLAYFILLSDFGLNQILVREISQSRNRNLHLYFNAFLIRVCFAFFFVILVGGSVLIFSGYEIYKIIIAELVLLLLIQNAINPTPLYDSFGIARYEALLKLSTTFLYTIGVAAVILLLRIRNLPLIVFISVVTQFIYSFVAVAIFHKKISPLPLKLSFSAIKNLLKDGRVIVWARLMAQIYTNMDLIMMNFLRGDRETGYYAIAYKLLFAALALNTAMYRVFLPLISELKGNLTALSRRLQQMGKLLAFSSLPIMALGIVFADKIVLFFYTSKYSASIIALRILLVYIALVGIGAIYGTTLFALGKNRKYTFALTLGAISNIMLNFILIPPFGLKGACIATLLAQIIVIAYTFLMLRKEVKFKIVKNILIFSAISFVSALIGYSINRYIGVSFLIAMLIGFLTYVFICISLRIITKSELERVGMRWTIGKRI